MTVMRKTILTSLILFLTTACVWVNIDSAELDYRRVETLTLDTGHISEIKINAAAGFLKIEGVSELEQIEVTADIQAFNSDIELSLVQEGDTALLNADANPQRLSNFIGNSPKIDLTLRLPKRLAVNIIDGSGAIEISNIDNSLMISDGSGSIEAEQISGDVMIKDGSGSIYLQKLGAALSISDGSGGINIDGVKGKVMIDDGSGEIHLRNLAKDVVLDDGSGSIDVKGVKGSLTISDGSGSIFVADVNGDFNLLDDSSGDLTLQSIGGNVNKR